jgi:glycolate oxidase iron-sulfur subunit
LTQPTQATQDDQENLLKGLDYSIVQQCMHCGMCLPTCPTYAETLEERSSPRGRIALMRGVADGHLEVSEDFAKEMYFCLGCLACQTACPAGVDYTNLFEHARAEIERTGVLATPRRTRIRSIALRWLFPSRRRLHALGWMLRLYQWTGLQWLVRSSRVLYLFPRWLRELEPLTPQVSRRFTATEHGRRRASQPTLPRHRVALLSGCVQDLAFADVNADTIDVLQFNGCEVLLPADQQCCGSLHGHNGELELARELARVNIDAFDPASLDAIIVNAGGCGSHMSHYDRLLADDEQYAQRAKIWSEKVRDIHEFLMEIDMRPPTGVLDIDGPVTYHESCHLRHGQGVSEAPRKILAAIQGLEMVELSEADWCCGSAGIYNITQPEMSMQLLDRKMGHVADTGATIVATGNPGCAVQIQHGLRLKSIHGTVLHPVTLLAQAYRAEPETDRKE